MTRKIALFVVTTFVASLLTGCDRAPAEIKADLAEVFCSLPFVCTDKNRVILDLQEENYTDYEIGRIEVQRPEQSDVRSAGRMVRWNKKQKSPVYIKVWWEAVYDRDTYYHGGNDYSQKKEKRPRPGSVWCEAVVKIKEPYPANPRHLNVYIYPGGRVEAEVAEHPRAVMSDDEKALLPRVSAGKYCEKTIDNPWYGIDTSRPGA